MSENNQVVVASPFLSLLTILFIYMKMTGKIDWSWWWVLSPVWIPAVFVLSILAIVLLGIIAVALTRR